MPDANPANPAVFILTDEQDAVHGEVVHKGDYAISILMVDKNDPDRELGEVFITLEGGELRVQLYDEEHVGSGNGEEFVLAQMANEDADDVLLDPGEGAEYGDVTSPPPDLHG